MSMNKTCPISNSISFLTSVVMLRRAFYAFLVVNAQMILSALGACAWSRAGDGALVGLGNARRGAPVNFLEQKFRIAFICHLSVRGPRSAARCSTATLLRRQCSMIQCVSGL